MSKRVRANKPRGYMDRKIRQNKKAIKPPTKLNGVTIPRRVKG